MEMPKYKCHKEVWALKIKAIDTLMPPPCHYSYPGGAICGYGPSESMHHGSTSKIVPSLGRHTYASIEPWTYGVLDQCLITPEEDGYAAFTIDSEYMLRHKPVVGGYYVVYEDGYKSFSPAKAFEDGYTKL